MITFLFGGWGSGKTTAILESIRKDTEAGIRTFLIVPEQEAVLSEHAALEALPASAELHLEVTNFSRLYNLVCREYGGLSYRYVTKPIRHLLMWQNLRELYPLLETYGSAAEDDDSLPELMLSAINEMKACGISPEELELAAKNLATDDPLAAKMRDLSLIYASFNRLVAEQYSDSADDLARLYDTLCHHRYFEGANVYLDSFTSFTAMEHKIIERIFAEANHVTVTVPLPSPDFSDISTAGIQRSLEALTRSAERHGGYKTVILQENKRTSSRLLSFLSEQLWQMDPAKASETPDFDGSLVAEICNTPYDEAEAAASHILELLRRGERCRDIVIVTRNPETYRGIIEPALEKNEIPFFFSEKTDLLTLPPIKLLFSALRIKQYHWQKNDIITHLKTGMYSIPLRDLDLFEEYMNTWNIKGSRFTDGDFTMNPDGFSEHRSPRGDEILRAANSVRRQLTEQLERFFLLLDAASNVADQCRAIYRYFEEIDLSSRLKELAAAEVARNNKKKAEEYRRLYSVILNTLADVGTALSEEEITTEELLTILRAVFKQTEIGTIPTSVDEVMIGSAATLRVAAPRYTFLLGLREGEFPAAVHDKGVWSTTDRKTLSLLGVTLSDDADTRSSDELMFVKRAMASPSHGLYLFTSTADTDGKAKSASLPFLRISALFPDHPPHRFDGSDLTYLAGSPKSALSHLRLMENSPKKQALLRALEEKLPHVRAEAETSAENCDCRVSPSLVNLSRDGSIRFSSSRFEKYVECPFNYYCTYVLGLREKKSSAFRASNMGTFIHYILEQLLKFALEPDESGQMPDNDTLVEKTRQTVLEYIDRICPEELRASRRLRHLYERLERLSLLMLRNIVEEFSHSEFRPAFFELSTNGRDGNPAPMEFVLSNGLRVSFSGIIDRVDVLKKDGEVFIRVVDYKTGTKQFSLDDVSHGINMQMLLYLFTLCRNKNNDFTRALGLPSDSAPSPAGIVYLSANIPVVEAEDYDNEAKILEDAADSLNRSGLLLADEAILVAMHDELSPKFLAGIKKNKDGDLTGKALAPAEGFSAIYDEIQNTVERITTELCEGKADATPLTYNGKDPCSFCDMKPICRRANS